LTASLRPWIFVPAQQIGRSRVHSDDGSQVSNEVAQVQAHVRQVARDGPRPAPGIDFAGLYAEHWRSLLRLAQGLVDDVASAEDIVQEAFAALYRNQSTLQEPAATTRYLRTCVLNGARSALRRRRTARAHLARVHTEDHEPGADERSLLTDEQERVRATLSALPGRQREVLTLRFLCELSDQEIAATTGMSPNNVRSAASRGLAALRTSIGERA
jgi:RNA polymerase sigma-70 factor (sigma-E family)